MAKFLYPPDNKIMYPHNWGGMDKVYIQAKTSHLIPPGIVAKKTTTVPVNEFPKIPQALGNAAYSLMYGLSNPTAQENIQQTIQRSVIRKFVPYVNQRAKLSPTTLHHVYEWNKVGVTSGRLFNPVIARVGRRKASFTVQMVFTPSKTLVPLTEAQLTPGPTGKVVKKRYRFYNKAQVMEFGEMVIIRRRGESWMAFDNPSGEGLRFTPGPVMVDYSTKPTYLQFNDVTNDFFSRIAPTLTTRALDQYGRKLAKAASTSAVVLTVKGVASDAAAQAQGERTANRIGPVSI